MVGAGTRLGMNKKEVIAELFIQIITASDTTANAIRSTILYIISTPRVYQSSKQEIKSVLDSGKILVPISNAQSKELSCPQVKNRFNRNDTCD